MRNLILCLSVQLIALNIYSQDKVSVEGDLQVQGEAKIQTMLAANSEDQLVVRNDDGTLGTRALATLLGPEDSTRTFQTDIKIAELACDCGISPFLAKSMLQRGYTAEDLIDADVPLSTLSRSDVPASDLLALGYSIEEMLDAGYLPTDLTDVGIAVSTLIGLPYQGGLIAFVDSANQFMINGLIVATADLPTNQWGCSANFAGQSGTLGFIGAGQNETLLIIANDACGSFAAAMDCDDFESDGYSDWFLPSYLELRFCYDNLFLAGQGGFSSSQYWSSTVTNNSTAFVVDFSDGSIESVTKDVLLKIRPVRYF